MDMKFIGNVIDDDNFVNLFVRSLFLQKVLFSFFFLQLFTTFERLVNVCDHDASNTQSPTTSVGPCKVT